MSRLKPRILAAAVILMSTPSLATAETLNLYAAGSLKAALTDVARAYETAKPGTKVVTEFAASGLLRERIEKGEPAHLFASADTGHPLKLVEAGKAGGPVRLFARNELCGLARPGLALGTSTLLDVMLDPAVKLGVSTPKADPAGDYAVKLFEKADQVSAGARDRLRAKALQLTGGPTSPKAPDGRNLYAWVMSSGQADVFLTYCTNAVLARRETADLQIVATPPALAVGAEYGMVIVNGAPGGAAQLADFIAGSAGQAIMARYGFGAGDAAK